MILREIASMSRMCYVIAPVAVASARCHGEGALSTTVGSPSAAGGVDSSSSLSVDPVRIDGRGEGALFTAGPSRTPGSAGPSRSAIVTSLGKGGGDGGLESEARSRVSLATGCSSLPALTEPASTSGKGEDRHVAASGPSCCPAPTWTAIAKTSVAATKETGRISHGHSTFRHVFSTYATPTAGLDELTKVRRVEVFDIPGVTRM